MASQQSEDGIPLKQDGTPDMRYKAAREAVNDDAGEGQGKPSGKDDPETTEDGQPLRKDGQPDQRFSENHGFAGSPERASEMGKIGGKTQPDHIYKPSEHDGLKKDGTEDKRTRSDHGFGQDHERASEMGKKGGHSNSTDDAEE